MQKWAVVVETINVAMEVLAVEIAEAKERLIHGQATQRRQ